MKKHITKQNSHIEICASALLNTDNLIVFNVMNFVKVHFPFLLQFILELLKRSSFLHDPVWANVNITEAIFGA